MLASVCDALSFGEHGHLQRRDFRAAIQISSPFRNPRHSSRPAPVPSGPNLTFRFAWAFSGGLACASLKNARANQHSIECRDCSELETVAANRNSPQKHVWRAKIVLDGRWSWHCLLEAKMSGGLFQKSLNRGVPTRYNARFLG